MTTSINVGQSLPLSISFLDQNGQPMSPAPTPDAAPQWSNATPGVETVAQSSDGLSATANAVSAGGDTIRVQLSVGGQTFTATLDVTVASVTPKQTLTSIEIVPGTATP